MTPIGPTDAPAQRIDKTGRDLQQRGLAATGGTEQSDDLAGRSRGVRYRPDMNCRD